MSGDSHTVFTKVLMVCSASESSVLNDTPPKTKTNKQTNLTIFLKVERLRQTAIQWTQVMGMQIKVILFGP